MPEPGPTGWPPATSLKTACPSPVALPPVSAHRVVTRQNDRRLTTGRRWVRNGDTWTVTGIDP